MNCPQLLCAFRAPILSTTSSPSFFRHPHLPRLIGTSSANAPSPFSVYDIRELICSYFNCVCVIHNCVDIKGSIESVLMSSIRLDIEETYYCGVELVRMFMIYSLLSNRSRRSTASRCVTAILITIETVVDVLLRNQTTLDYLLQKVVDLDAEVRL